VGLRVGPVRVIANFSLRAPQFGHRFARYAYAPATFWAISQSNLNKDSAPTIGPEMLSTRTLRSQQFWSAARRMDHFPSHPVDISRKSHARSIVVGGRQKCKRRARGRTAGRHMERWFRCKSSAAAAYITFRNRLGVISLVCPVNRMRVSESGRRIKIRSVNLVDRCGLGGQREGLPEKGRVPDVPTLPLRGITIARDMPSAIAGGSGYSQHNCGENSMAARSVQLPLICGG
jgi:hypothetical protein